MLTHSPETCKRQRAMKPSPNLPAHFGEIVRAARRARRLSRAALAQHAGCSYGAIFLIERGRQSEVGLVLAARLAHLLQFSLDSACGFDHAYRQVSITAPRAAPSLRPDGTCHVKLHGDRCSTLAVARGYCMRHYQSARRFGWPRPAPLDFAPPRFRGARRELHVLHGTG